MGFDSFAAELPCPACKKVAPSSRPALMQTRIRTDPRGELLRVGDRIDFAPGGPADSGYLEARPAADRARLHLLEIWACPHCEATPNWAEVVLQGDTVLCIDAVGLDRDTLARVDYVTGELLYYFDDIVGEPLYLLSEPSLPQKRPVLRTDWLARLRDAV